MSVRLHRAPGPIAAVGGGVVHATAPLRELAASLLSIVSASAAVAGTLLDPHADLGMDLSGLQLADADEVLM